MAVHPAVRMTFDPQPLGESISYVRMHGSCYRVGEQQNPNNPAGFDVAWCVCIMGDGPDMTPREMADALREAAKTAIRYVQIVQQPQGED